jgi:hypothetical protein
MSSVKIEIEVPEELLLNLKQSDEEFQKEPIEMKLRLHWRIRLSIVHISYRFRHSTFGLLTFNFRFSLSHTN